MASFRAEIDDSFVKKLTNLGARRENVIQMMLDDGGQIMADALEREIRAKHTKDDHAGAGELADSIELSSPYLTKRGIWMICAYPAGKSVRKMAKGKVYKRSKHGTMTSGKALYNSDKLFFLEYGNSKQTARPFLDRVTKSVEKKIMDNMQKIYDREVEKI